MSFINLFTRELDYRGIEGVDWKPIPIHLMEWLERPFEEEEIRRAVFDCDGNKAPGSDGYTLAVFQANWEVIKEDLMTFCLVSFVPAERYSDV